MANHQVCCRERRIEMNNRVERVEVGKVSRVVLIGAKFTCTKCKRTKAATKFGLRKMADGTVRNQAQCCKCRSTK